MVAFRLIFTFVVIFLLTDLSLAFDAFIEGKEYKFNYRSESRGIREVEKFIGFGADLTIKVLPGNKLECQMSTLSNYNNTIESEETFKVQLDGEKVLEVTNSTEDIRNKWMIEAIIKDRSEIVRLIKEGHTSAVIEMPYYWRTMAELIKETDYKGDIVYKARIENFGETKIEVIYDKVSNKQTGLVLSIDQAPLFIHSQQVNYKGSNDIAPEKIENE